MSRIAENEDEEHNQSPEFRFITEPNKRGVRSHAMREHWKERRRRISQEKKIQEGTAKKYLPIQPSVKGSSSGGSAAGRQAPPVWAKPISTIDELPQHPSNSSRSSSDEGSLLEGPISGIPSQVLSGVNLALSSGRLDPFDQFPVKLTAEHHKLLHHWLSTFGVMMFGDQNLLAFNPMRDVWLPLDLSNAASFNAIMAHAAAHLARMRGRRVSMEALKFKTEAIRIISLWMKEERLALSDEVLAAVLRLLTFERYWGSESEWQVHHDGLLRMIEARGGITALQTNWRLELVATLITLMGKPSWFDSSNQIQELCKPAASNPLQPILSDELSLHRVRSLWLLSFIQDMGNFMTASSELYLHGLTRYLDLQEALTSIKLEMHQAEQVGQSSGTYTQFEHQRLSCLIFISVLLQGSQSNTSTRATSSTDSSNIDDAQASGLVRIAALDSFLRDNRSLWLGSVQGLFSSIFDGFVPSVGSSADQEYVLSLTDVLGSMSLEARHGVERCLLHLLGQAPVDIDGDLDNDWTPDALLSNIHGE